LGYSIAIDATSCLASRTGVGIYVGELARALLASPGENKFRLCAASAHRDASARLSQRFPQSEICVRNIPVRLLAPLIDRIPWLRSETIFGSVDAFHAGPFLIPAGKTTAIIVTIHDLTPVRFPEFHLLSNRFTIPQLRKRLARADRVIVPSASTGSDLQDFGIVSPDKVRVIPLAAVSGFRPLDRDIAALSALGLEPGYILNVGALEPRKNLPRLVEAYRFLKDHYKISCKLVLAGPRGWKDSDIFQVVQRLKLSDSVVFTGYVSSEILNLLYNHASLFVYPSLYEGFGLPPLEAMASGCPVAVSKSSSLPEVVGDAGVYFDPIEAEEMALAIFRVLDSHEFRSKLVERGLARSRQFSWSKTAAATNQVYREAIESRRQT
jgi:glycosyltransferase involved in cell wall biosynthesis